ncbi:MAG: ribosomal L7Ae/L30e/S12e/Gadd45 family protein [Oscillospiraceae bacterium]|nr:ribosomal L7Ae/L30e/S12e/Gadd45 family protein [Oscillospiraceae bacterium]
MAQDRVLSMIGLAKRAGAASIGESMCSSAIKSGRSGLVIIACDASDNTKKSIKNSCEYYNVKYVEYSDKSGIGGICGLNSVAAVSVNDDNFVKGITEKLG